jgi:bifunctional UDP-N-acetylglucosamine pyrophosphorylase/glucosamine-1-phosphate N-acetyltransferase
LSQTAIEVVILAAGLGKRMKSDLIKVLHRAAGRPIVDYVLDLAASLTTTPPVMIIGHQRDAVRESCGERARYVVQEEQLGTGHAILQAASLLDDDSLKGKQVVILSGDVPLTRPESLRRMIDAHQSSGSALTLLSMPLEDPALYGRIVRDADGRFVRIVEAKDASAEELEINEVNAGIYIVAGEHLFRLLRQVGSSNAQKEYYLTDIIEMLGKEGHAVAAHVLADPVEALGVNSRQDLAVVEGELVRRKIESLMEGGVTFRNPSAVTVDSAVEVGSDTVVYPFVTLEGATVIGKHCVIEPGVHLRDCKIGDRVQVKTGTVAEGSVIEEGAAVGPYSHLRAGTVLGPKVKVGNFVETKKAVFGAGAKASHLSYIGDAEVGADSNIGAGTITCNYDGVNKHKTIIEEGVFIGSDSQLVAPVRIGKGAYVGAGSTVTKDVPPDALALSRTPQKTIAGWAVQRREKLKKN